MKKLSFTVLLFLFAVTISKAQNGESELYQELEKAEADLIAVMIKLRKNLSSADQNALHNSQMDWKNFRESNCTLKSKRESEGGVIANKIFIDCKLIMTEKRLQELNDLLINGF